MSVELNDLKTLHVENQKLKEALREAVNVAIDDKVIQWLEKYQDLIK